VTWGMDIGTKIGKMMSMIRLCLAALLALALPPASIAAQSQVVFAFVGVHTTDESLTGAEVRVLENRLTASLVQVAEKENFGLIIPNNRQKILSEIGPRLGLQGNQPMNLEIGTQVAARAIVAGEANHVGTRYYLDLETIQVDNGRTLNRVSGDFAGYEELITGSQGLVFSLFQLSENSTAPAGRGPAAISRTPTAPAEISSAQFGRFVPSVELNFISGTWQGDKGINTVEIQNDGTGVAALDDKNTMKLRVTIDKDQVIVRQDEPNSPKMYLPFFPYSIAVQIVELARPMSWVFRLTSDHNTLDGTKETSFFRIDRGNVVYVDNTYTRAAEWHRIR